MTYVLPLSASAVQPRAVTTAPPTPPAPTRNRPSLPASDDIHSRRAVMTWVRVKDTSGRARLECRWLLALPL